MTPFEQIVKITSDYLGPAAERFVTRQIEFHLNKKPEELTKADIPKLSDKVRVSLAMLTQDQKMVEEAAQRIEKLAIN